jgi:replication-associated recombination protein RarA
VRSNDAGQIGFLREPQRVNVLLSRARIGFILIGNHRTLLKCRNPTGRRLWETVLEQMQLCEGLPVVCENHSQKTLVKSPSDFAEYAKDGGCKLACGMPLPSCPEGHLCPMRCHPLGDKPHEGVLCKVLLDAKCPNGHKVKRECWAESPQRCLVKVQDDCQLGHVRTRTCSDAPLQKCDGCDRAEERRMQREKRKMEAAEALASKRLKAEEELADVIEQSEVEKAVDKSASETRRIEEEARLVQEELARQREERSMSVKRDGENKRHCKGPVDGKGFLPYRSVAGDGVKKPADGSSAAAQSVDETCPDSATGPEALPQRERFSKRKKAQRSDLEDPMGIADLLSGRTPGAPAVEEAGQMNTDAAAREPSSWSAASSSLSAADAGEGSDDDESMHDVGESDETASAASAAAAAAHASPRNNAASRSKGESQKMQQSPPGQQLDGGFDDVKEAVAILNIKKPVYDKAYKMAGAVVKDGGGVHGHACAEAVVVLASIGLGDKPGDLKEEYEDVIRRFPMDQVDERTRATLLFVKAEMEFCDGQYLQTAARDARLFLEMPFAAETMPGWTARCKHIVENASDRNAARGSRPKANNNKSEADKWRMYKANAQGRVTDVLPEAMDDLMGMIGLERVKRDFRNELERIQLCKEQGVSADTSLYNARFDGNPGVGKTTVARLYAKFLVQLQILPDGAAILETSGPKLASEGLAELEKLLGKGKSRGGAVIFVDEAYALNPKEDRNGRQVLDFMLPVAEKLKGDYGKVVFIFAGYNKDMEKLFEHNPGLPSRFPRHFTFDDYTDDELEAILHGHLVNPNGVKPSDEQDGKKKSMAGSKPPGVLSSIKPPTAGGVNGYTGGFYSPDRAAVVPGELPHGTVKEDEWGHEWTFDAPSHTWEGDYGNQCGFGPADAGRPLGSKCNPIYSTGAGGRDGDPLLEFIYDRKLKQWQALTDDGARVKTLVYPGEPEAVLIVMPAFTLSDAKWGRIAVRRLGKMRGKMGFGNARAVKNLFDTALRRQADRITRARERGEGPDIYELRRDDLLGPRADKSKLESCEALQELMRMEGLEEVKESVRNLLGLVIKNAELEEQEKPLLEVMLNRVFLGNPGTGKTTVAKLYGRILCDFGMISKGDVILKNPSDFKGDVIGSSERNTREILHAAEGCVLVIDEAYALNPKQGNVGGLGSSDPYLTGVIDTIVECVQAVPGDDRVVVLCGYRKEMEAMVKDSNPGLARRFQLDNAFVFHDYDESSLVRILRGKAKLAGLPITVETAASAVGQLEKARSQGNFGNAGAVENLLCQAKLKMVEEKRSRLDPSDFCSEVNEDEGREEDIFADLQGECHPVISDVHDICTS